jgi:hypothetical protein
MSLESKLVTIAVGANRHSDLPLGAPCALPPSELVQDRKSPMRSRGAVQPQDKAASNPEIAPLHTLLFDNGELVS